MCIPEIVLNKMAFRQKGVSLVELIMFIMIISIGVAGILSVMNVTTANSADPMVRKQAQAVAESLLEEIELQPFTYCDPDDTNAATATGAFVGAGGCATTVEAMGPEGETRYAAPQFDNVNDYHGFTMNPIVDINNSPIAGLAGFTATVTISQAGAAFSLPAADVLQIDVRVTSGNIDIPMTGYRFRYAPNAVP
ncbi:type IV pilus modification PilV family protein [Sulfurirhabdus autotrophica]|uniref:MSHA pilin protein MshD n=1 Tax=Sulfurirhabdus autotrophica TaxID=1706046 RepID=A0A4R3XZJ9_9PROT|nr:type II secretion system protein [Sulfurirhabdus autotrophica]TCV85215.1 MSHA pilin protein MshD [Sulfurirhabdus autotrophica]